MIRKATIYVISVVVWAILALCTVASLVRVGIDILTERQRP